VIQQIKESNIAKCTMATLAQECEHDVLSPADLPREIDKVREDLSAERDGHLRMMTDFVLSMSMYRGQ
jgi:hypothetical protein